MNLSPEVFYFAFILGVAVSIWLYDRRHVTPGGVIAATYIGIHVFEPVVMAVTITSACLLVGFLYNPARGRDRDGRSRR